MIAQAKEDHPTLSERGLCQLFSVSRSWYYQRSSVQLQPGVDDVELRAYPSRESSCKVREVIYLNGRVYDEYTD